MRFSGGWVKLTREDAFCLIRARGSETLGLWAKLLCLASRFPVEVHRKQYPAGTVVTSLAELADSQTQREFSKLRRDLDFLESIGKIKQENTPTGRVILIENWLSDEVDYYEKRPKFRHCREVETTEPFQNFDSPCEIISDRNNLGNLTQFFVATDPMKENDRPVDRKRQYIGEGDKEEEERYVIRDRGEIQNRDGIQNRESKIQTRESKIQDRGEIQNRASEHCEPAGAVSPIKFFYNLETKPTEFHLEKAQQGNASQQESNACQEIAAREKATALAEQEIYAQAVNAKGARTYWARPAALAGGSATLAVAGEAQQETGLKANCEPFTAFRRGVTEAELGVFRRPTTLAAAGEVSTQKTNPETSRRPATPSPTALLQIWNDHRDKLPEAKAFTPARRRQAAARLRECPDLAHWEHVARTLAANPFCNGKNERGWTAGFDFFLKPSTHVKVSEGFYAARKKSELLRPKTVKEIVG